MFIMTYNPLGYEGVVIRVEADIRRGIPGIDISGLAAAAVREARERVRAAFRNCGFKFPSDRVLINLAPAGVRKDGAALDLAIALAVMAAEGDIPPASDTMVLGELELSGRVRPVRGTLAAAAAGRAEGIRDFIVPRENGAEAAILDGCRVAAVDTLNDAVDALLYRERHGSLPEGSVDGGDAGGAADGDTGAKAGGTEYVGDFADVKGQRRYKRALEIAAAGAHNLLVFGPPGSGKTMLARRLPQIMPRLSQDEAVSVTRLHSLAGEPVRGLIDRPPFRSPHHSASAEGILGGGRSVRPGEISLAHFGALFLDEAPEFRINVLQSLREPLEDRVITISRAEGSVRLPADFQLLMAANPCPCGRLGIRGGPGGRAGVDAGCYCSGEEIHRYWRKFGGALLDRMELRIAVNAPEVADLSGEPEEAGAAVAERVERAAAVQRERFAASPARRNSGMSAAEVERYCRMDDAALAAFTKAAEKLGISGRAYHGILRVARTIADLEAADSVRSEHVLEAVQYRRQGDDPYDVFSA